MVQNTSSPHHICVAFETYLPTRHQCMQVPPWGLNQSGGNQSWDSVEHDLKLSMVGRPKMNWLTKFNPIQSTVCLQMCQNCSTNELAANSPPNLSPIQSVVCLQMQGNCLGKQRPWYNGNSMEHDQKLITPGEAYTELTHPIWAQSDKPFA